MTATDTKAALLRAVCENPGDDLPRLAYADWLEERGGTVVSTYIRVAIERDRSPLSLGVFDKYKHAWESLRVAIDARLTDHVPHCVNEMIQRDGERNAWFMDRGFLTSIVCPMKWFMESAIRLNDIFRVCPIGNVRLRDRSPESVTLPDGTRHWEWEFVKNDGVRMYEYESTLSKCYLSEEMRQFFPEQLVLSARRTRIPPEWASCVRLPTEQTANDALSRACVNYGRRMAGLPPLPPLP